MTHIPTEDLAAAVAAFPDWLAADVTAWVRKAEGNGVQFPSALDAVTRALSWINVESAIKGALS